MTLLAAVLLCILWWCFRKAFYMPDNKKAVDPRSFFGKEKDAFCKDGMHALVGELEALPFEPVTIRSHDGLKLYGRLYLSEESDVIDLIFHGWRGNALRDGCGGSRLARDAKHSILLVDQRAHGESDGNVITFGIQEKYDCMDWIDYTVSRFGKEIKILLVGVSMGAATVLMASSLPLPPQVKGIAADCPYSSPEAIIRKVCRDMGIPDRPAFPLVRLSARLLGGFSVKDGGAVEAVKHARVPILLVHGTEDDFVPIDMCREIAQSCASQTVVLEVPGAGHGLSYFYDTEAYRNAVARFHELTLQ